MGWLVLVFIGVPLLELYLLLWLGTLIGFWPTLGIAVATGAVGSALAKREGLKVWREWRAALDELRPPAYGVVEALLVLVGGVLLITPGVLTDLTGLLLLVPPVRRRVAAYVRRRVDARIGAGQLHVVRPHAPPGTSGSPYVDRVIETTGESAGDTEQR